MPINGFSDRVRLERLGKIRLGVRVPSQKDPSKTYPQATEYFVCPPAVAEVVGGNPTEIFPIMFPTDNPDDWLSQFYRCYSMSYGLVCMGDGVKANQRTDLATGAVVDRNTQEGNWAWREVSCEGEDCPLFQKKMCRPQMRLQFLLPEVPGLGVWELVTSSRNSRLNIQSTIHLIRSMTRGCIKMIPLTLALEGQEATPMGGKKKTVHIVHLKHKLRLADFLALASTPIAEQFQLASPAGQTPETASLEEPPEDLMPPFEEEEATQAQSNKAPAKSSKPATEPPKKTDPKPSGPAIIKEQEMRKLADNLFGAEGWETIALPMMKEKFGMDDYSKLQPDQQHYLWTALKAKFSKDSMVAAEKAPEKKPAPEKHKDPPDIVTLRRKLQTVLMEKGKTMEQCFEWLKANCNRSTSEGMTQKELEDAIGKASIGEGQTAPLF